jgi:four helix bundle protein
MDLAISMHQLTRSMQRKQNVHNGLIERLIQSVFRIELRISESNTSWVFSRSELLRMALFHLSETEFYLECAHQFKYIECSDYDRLLSDISHVRLLIAARIDSIKQTRSVLTN